MDEMSQEAAYAISMASEALAAALLAFILWRDARLSALAAAAAILGTAITHPIVWPSALWLYAQIGYWPGFLLVETFAVLAETLGYRLMTRQEWVWCLLLSFAANGLSLSLGLVCQRLY